MGGGGSTKDYREILQVDLDKDSRLCLLSPAVSCVLYIFVKRLPKCCKFVNYSHSTAFCKTLKVMGKVMIIIKREREREWLDNVTSDVCTAARVASNNVWHCSEPL